MKLQRNIDHRRWSEKMSLQKRGPLKFFEWLEAPKDFIELPQKINLIC